MMQEELNALETSFRQQGLTWNQTNFAVAVIRNYVEPLRQQLEASQKREVMLREALTKYRNIADPSDWSKHPADKSLAATVDLDGLILCEKEPVGSVSLVMASDIYWGGRLHKANPESYLGAAFCKPVTHGDTLYRAWEPK